MPEPLISQATIYRAVQTAIGEALQIPEEKVTPDRSLIKDLGVESLDLIDINFRLEQDFNIVMPRKYLLDHVEELFGEGTAIDDQDRLTGAAVTIWNARLGSTGTAVHAGMSIEAVPAVHSPRTLVMVVEEILVREPRTCPAWRKSAWTVADERFITCGQCGARAPLSTGDDVIRQWLEDFRARGGLTSHTP